MLEREIEKELAEMADSYPVVTIIGPRQSGKTFISREVFPEKAYVNLEHPNERELAQEDPESFLEKYENGAILDEIQRAPELLSFIQVMVDENDTPGRFILTGSHQFELHEAITQSLAGRTAILKLLPLSISELQQNGSTLDANSYMLYGGYPRLFEREITPYKFYSHYCQTYLEKDVRRLINLKDISSFQRFMKLAAARVGSIINASDIASDIGVSSPTISSWLSILEASYLIFRLPPYLENFGKRQIKSAKFYFTDVGLACFLLGIENINQLDRDPLRGQLFENLVIIEALKTRYNQGLDSNLYFFRDQQKNEVDLIVQKGAQAIPVEIKISKRFQKKFLDGLKKFETLAKDRVTKPTLCYSGEPEQAIGNYQLINFKHIGNHLK